MRRHQIILSLIALIPLGSFGETINLYCPGERHYEGSNEGKDRLSIIIDASKNIATVESSHFFKKAEIELTESTPVTFSGSSGKSREYGNAAIILDRQTLEFEYWFYSTGMYHIKGICQVLNPKI